MNKKYNPENSKPKTLLLGASAGILSQSVAQPFFMAKIRMQVASSKLKIGDQHQYTSLRNLFATVYRTKGVLGFWAGLEGALGWRKF